MQPYISSASHAKSKIMNQVEGINESCSFQSRSLSTDELKSVEVLINTLVQIEVDFYKD